MPKPRLIRSKWLPYHVFARSNNKDWFYLPQSEMWQIFSERLNVISKEFQVELHAFVMMSNHFHALLSTPEANLDEAMLYFMRESSREVNRRTGRINHVFGGPYRWSLIENRRYYETVTRYVYQNPLRAGLCGRVEDYPYGTLKFLSNSEQAPFPIEESSMDRRGVLDLPVFQRLDWLNEPCFEEEKECIRRGLRYAQFKVRARNVSRRTQDYFASR